MNHENETSSQTGKYLPIMVSLNHPVFLIAPGASEKDVESDVSRLRLISTALKDLSVKLGKMVFWVYVSLESGIHIYTALAALVVLALLTIAALHGSGKITGTLLQISSAAKRLSSGDFSARLDVKTGDERDQMIQAFNELGPKLVDQVRIQNSLRLAREVQQNLLPLQDPEISGLDIAGTSIYCDETGGDYYDYYLPANQSGATAKVGMVVGDLSGHGLPSALLMASARALLRQRTSMPGSIAEIVTDVNRVLTADVAESGNFMTLFFLSIDLENRQLRWVRAGHSSIITLHSSFHAVSHERRLWPKKRPV